MKKRARSKLAALTALICMSCQDGNSETVINRSDSLAENRTEGQADVPDPELRSLDPREFGDAIGGTWYVALPGFSCPRDAISIGSGYLDFEGDVLDLSNRLAHLGSWNYKYNSDEDNDGFISFPFNYVIGDRLLSDGEIIYATGNAFAVTLRDGKSIPFGRCGMSPDSISNLLPGMDWAFGDSAGVDRSHVWRIGGTLVAPEYLVANSHYYEFSIDEDGENEFEIQLNGSQSDYLEVIVDDRRYIADSGFYYGPEYAGEPHFTRFSCGAMMDMLTSMQNASDGVFHVTFPGKEVFSFSIRGIDAVIDSINTSSSCGGTAENSVEPVENATGAVEEAVAE